MLRPPRPANLLASVELAWRRSLQVRIVTFTLVISGALVVMFGLLVGYMITDGTVRAKTERSQKLATAGSEYAVSQLGSLISDSRETSASVNVQTVLSELGRRGEGSDVDVAIIPADPFSVLPGQSFPHERAYLQVPAALKEAVRQGSHGSFVNQRLNLDVDGTGPRLYLVFGRQLEQRWGNVQLYYFYPLDDEVRQATLVRNTIAITGFSLVIMMALVAGLVTRMVVRPVRLAARTAQRLSNGLLDQRMEVKGEDDLAALAASFNQMAENLQRHILRLEEMSRLQRRFTSDVSHELRTPLTTVRMAADVLFSNRERFEPPVARSAELLQAELDRLGDLLTELLEISRFDAGFAMLDAEPTNLVPLVRRAVDRLSPLAERAGVPVEVDVPSEPVVAEVDVRRVERILRNLIGNAVEHGEGKPVRVRLAASEGVVALTVRDYGVGLRAGEEKLVFNRFWRADPSRARQTGGTGLGLSISSEDARLHGGWLEAWGQPGEGAQFRLTLPVRSGDRLTSSPLRLVPADARLVSIVAEPDPIDVDGLSPIVITSDKTTVESTPAGPEPARVGDGGRDE
ncbi:MAG: MtrAB system histidine kinase MtrB [Micromonosporaceae bacterium]